MTTQLTVFALRHVATRTFMPQVKNRRGYSHWYPGQPFDLARDEIRLFLTRGDALTARGHWARGPAENRWDKEGEHLGVRAQDIGRKVDELEVVEFLLAEKDSATSPA